MILDLQSRNDRQHCAGLRSVGHLGLRKKDEPGVFSRNILCGSALQTNFNFFQIFEKLLVVWPIILIYCWDKENGATTLTHLMLGTNYWTFKRPTTVVNLFFNSPNSESPFFQPNSQSARGSRQITVCSDCVLAVCHLSPRLRRYPMKSQFIPIHPVRWPWTTLRILKHTGAKLQLLTSCYLFRTSTLITFGYCSISSMPLDLNRSRDGTSLVNCSEKISRLLLCLGCFTASPVDRADRLLIRIRTDREKKECLYRSKRRGQTRLDWSLFTLTWTLGP